MTEFTQEQLDLLAKAREFSHAAHDSINQKRKVTEQPYWVHTDEVSDIVARYTNNINIIIAAKFHDIIEDVFPKNPYYNIMLITTLFGAQVAQLVIELTDVYTKEAYPNLNRKARKKLEAERIANISKEAKLIKMADNFSNTKDIAVQDPGFAPLYLTEIWTKMPTLREGSEELYAELEKQVIPWLDHFGIKH